MLTVLAGMGSLVIAADNAVARGACGAEKMATDDRKTPDSGLSSATRSGPAPLEVTFSVHGGGTIYFGGVWLDFGDGERAMVCRPGSGCRKATATHTYSQTGTYCARLTGEGEGEPLLMGSVTITVGR